MDRPCHPQNLHFPFVFLLTFGAILVWTNSERLFASSPDVRTVHVIGLIAAGAMCGASLAGVVVALVKRRAARDTVGSAP
jgi:hypothetical protein